jgi:Tfp pilus assembly protein PilV
LEPRMINIHRALCFSSHRLSSLPRRKCLCALAIVVRRRWRQRWCCWKSSCRKKIVSSTF